MIVKGPASTASDVARYLIWHSQRHGDPITNLKLQKLLYYAYGWYLALYEGELFADPIRAWVRGPAVHGVWRQYNYYGWRPIEALSASEPAVPNQVKVHLNEVLRAYGDFSALTLEDMTHKESPWLKARKGVAPDEASTILIDKNEIKEHFVSLARKSAARKK